MMNEDRKPFVVLEHFDFDSASDVKQFNSKNDDHKLYVNMSPNCESVVSDEGQREKKFYLKKSSQKVVRNVDSPVNDVPKRVSFSNRSRVFYYNDDTNALYSSVIFDNMVHASEQPFVESPSDTESNHPEIAPENKQFHPLEKDLVIVLEKLPVDLMKQVKNENSDHRKRFQSVTHLSDSQNFNEGSNLQSTESQVSELTMSDDKQKLKTDLSLFKTVSTDSSSELNASLHQELKVSIQRLPDHLLEPYLNNNSFKSSEGNLNSSKQEDSYEDVLSLTENKVVSETEGDLSLTENKVVSETEGDLSLTENKVVPETKVNSEFNDPSLIQQSALNIDVDSSHCTPSEPLKQESFEHENNVYNCEVSISTPCVLIERLNGDVDSSYSISSEPLKQESCEHENSVYNSDVSIRNPCALNEALNGDVNSSYSIPSEPQKQESCEHENNVYDCDVSVRNPCVLTEALNEDVNSSSSIPSEPLKQESCEHENNVYNSDVSIRNPCMLNEALNEDVNSSYSTPSEPLRQESCDHQNNIYNCDVPIRNPCVLIERLNLIVPKIDSIQSTKKSQKRKGNEKDKFCDEQDDINDNLMETESEIMLGSTDKPLIGSSKLSKTSKRKKRLTIKSVNTGKNPKCLSHQVKASNRKSKSQLQVRNKTSIPIDNIHFPSHKVTEIIPVDSHNLSCATNVGKQCDLSPTKTKLLSDSEIHFKHTDPPLLQLALNGDMYSSDCISKEPLKQKSYQNKSYAHSSGEDELPLICLSKQSSYLETLTRDSDKQISEKCSSTEHQSAISNNSSSEDDIALSLFSKPDDDPNVLLSVYNPGICPLSHCLKNSSNIERTSGISNLNVSKISTSTGNQCHMSNFSTSEDDMPLSLLHKLNNVKQAKILGRIKKKKKRSQKSKTSGTQKFTDFNVMHVSEMTPPNASTFMSDFKKKVKKTPSTKKIERKKLSKKEMLLFSRLNDMDNVKQTKIVGHIEKKKKRSQKSKTSGMQKFTDFNVMHVAEMTVPNSLTFMSDFKKKVKKTPTKKNGRKKPSKKVLFSRLGEIDALEFLAQVKESNLKKHIKSGAKKCNSELFLLSKQTKQNYIKGSTLVSHEDQASNCKSNSARHLKTMSDNRYYATVESDADSDISPPLKTVKLDNYDLSCNMYKASKKKSVAVPTKNNVTVTKKSRKKKDCQSKKKRTSNELHISLRNYLNKFFTEFDSLGVSKKKGVGFSRKENEFVKKKESIYKMLIREMHHHLKSTCSIKKSFKNQRLKEKLNKRSLVQIPHIKVESEDDFPSIPARPKGNSRKRKGNKENHIDKFRLGFLTGDKFLGLYNRCVAAERLILLKYKMKKQQRRKIKRFFKTLKKNSLRRN